MLKFVPDVTDIYCHHCDEIHTGIGEVLAIRRIFSLVDMITKPKF